MSTLVRLLHAPPSRALSLAPIATLVAVPAAGLAYGVFGGEHSGLLSPGEVLRWSGRSLALAMAVVAVVAPAGLGLAWLEQRTDYPGRKLLGVLCLMPIAVPSYLLAAVVREQLGPVGFLGRLWSGTFTGFVPAVLTLSVITVPFVQLLVSAALRRSSAAEEEAAQLGTADPRRRFTVVMLPRLRSALSLSALLAFLYVISDFGAVAVLDYPALTWRLYRAVGFHAMGEAVVYGMALLLMAAPVVVLAVRLRRSGSRWSSVANPRPHRRHELGGWRLAAAWLGQGSVVVLGVVMPVATLTDWLLDGWRHGQTFASIGGPLLDTLRVAGLGALFTVVIAAGLAWWDRRGGNAASTVVLGVGALPGVLIAFGLLMFGLLASRHLGLGRSSYQWITQSGVLLLLGYAIRFVGEAFAAMQTSFRQLDARQLDGARLLDRRGWRTLRWVLLPTVSPGVAVAAAMVAVAIAKELPVTLMLGSSLGLRTLSYRVFDRYEEAFLHDAGASGLVLLTLAFGAFFSTARWRHHV